MSSRRSDQDEHRSNIVKNSHSSRDTRRDNRRDGNYQRTEQRRNDAERCHDSSSSYNRRRLAGDDEQHRRVVDRRDARWGRERDEQQRPKRRERPEFTEERAEQEPVDPERPSWQNTKVRKHAEMLKERKLLWKGKGGEQQQHEAGKEHGEAATNATTPTSDESKHIGGTETTATERKEKKLEHKWQSMIAATAQDTQQMDKFQRLMGMKKETAAPPPPPPTAAASDPVHSQQQVEAENGSVYGPAAAPPSVPDSAELNRERMRQMELQRGLNQQFELARQSHHCGRGRGLGSF